MNKKFNFFFDAEITYLGSVSELTRGCGSGAEIVFFTATPGHTD